MTSEATGLFNSRASASTSTSFFSCFAGASEISSPLRSPHFPENVTFINFANTPILSAIPDHLDPIHKLTAQRLSLYFDKFSWHPCYSDSDCYIDRSSIYSSCPSIGSSFSSEISPPTPPPRRAESFRCVSNHLYVRAVAAQRSYYDYLNFVSTRHSSLRMTQETGPTVNLINPSDDSQSFQAERSLDDDLPSPSNELTTPSYTPPPPIDSSYDCSPFPASSHDNEDLTRRNPPMFIYSYDPPSPEINSEYDPPFYSSPPSNISESTLHANDQKKDAGWVKSPNDQPLIRPESDLSSSTLSATLLLTQDSDVSPLPPHADRVSSLNTDTLASSPNTLLATSDPSATYTCTSPAFSYNSDTLTTAPDLSKITMNDFDNENVELDNAARASPEEIEAKDSCTPDTICVSPLHSERASQSHSKISEDPSLPTRSLSDSRKKSTEGTTGSSDRARRSSPPSSPDLSLSSLPSDTITMNTGIDSIATDTDSNENPAPTQSNRNRASQSMHSQDETDPTTDSAFASPSTSPTCTLSLSCSVTPVPGRDKKSGSTEGRAAKDSDEGFDKETFVVPSSDENIISDEASTTKNSREKSVESNPYTEFVDETAENESIYPESECEIRLVSRADTEVADSAQRDSSPDAHTTPIIAELCHLEEEKTEKQEYPIKSKESTLVRDLSSSSIKEISSSGNSSMSNSPALSAETNNLGKRLISQELKDEISSNNNAHLNNWLHNSRPSEVHSNNEASRDPADTEDSKSLEATEAGIIIEEISSDIPSCPYLNGSRSLPSFGPLPTIHEVVDTPTDNTPISDAVTIASLDNVENFTNPTTFTTDSSSIISSFVHSDSPQVGSSSASLSGNKNSAASFGNLPPPPPPRSLHAQLKTPPLPPPPADDDGDFNPFPLPPPPSEEACLPPLPPPPVTYYSECAPPVPPHSVGPTPPQRMYLLIPLAPGLRSPQRLLSPPPAPPRSTSLRRSPPPPLPSMEAYRYTENHSNLQLGVNEDTNEDDRTISSPSDVGSVICVTSKLTPLPEEVSPTSSPLPPALLIAANENKTSHQTDAGSHLNTKSSLQSNAFSELDSSLSQTNTTKNIGAPLPPVRQRKSLTPTPLLPQSVSETFTNNSDVNDQFAGTKLTENFSKMKCNQEGVITPPPPPPPQKQAFLKEKPSEDMHASQPRAALQPQSSLMSVSAYGKLVVDRSDIALPTPLEEVGRVFTSAIRWGYLMEGVDTIAMYTQIRPIIQHGPQCGLVALSMASQICGGASCSSSRCQSAVPPATPTTPSTPVSGTTASGMSAAELLESAQAQGFSTHGEMFSAESLANLANMKLGDSVEASVRRGVLEDKHVFLELILSGALILVPYDAQPNHQPGKFSGHKAHWGVVSGALVQSRKFTSGASSARAFARPDARIDNLWHVRRGHHSSSRSSSRPPSRASSRAEDAQKVAEDEKASTKSRRERSSSPPWRKVEPERSSRSMTPGGFRRASGGVPNETALLAFLNVAPDDMTVVVLWRQGKSRGLVSSTLEELCASNAQLYEYPQAQTDSGLEKDFVIGDVQRGLAGQVVVVSKTTLPLTDLSDLLDRLQKQ